MNEHGRGFKSAMNRGDARLIFDTKSYRALRRTGLSDALFIEAWRRADLTALLASDSKEMRLTVDMGRVIGQTLLVQAPVIDPRQPTLFAKRRGAYFPSRVMHAAGLPNVNHVSLIGERAGRRTWVLRTGYLGHVTPPDLFDLHAIWRAGYSLRSVLSFWCRHAFVHRPEFFDKMPPEENTFRHYLDVAGQRNEQQVLDELGYAEVMRMLEVSVSIA